MLCVLLLRPSIAVFTPVTTSASDWTALRDSRVAQIPRSIGRPLYARIHLHMRKRMSSAADAEADALYEPKKRRQVAAASTAGAVNDSAATPAPLAAASAAEGTGSQLHSRPYMQAPLQGPGLYSIQQWTNPAAGVLLADASMPRVARAAAHAQSRWTATQLAQVHSGRVVHRGVAPALGCSVEELQPLHSPISSIAAPEQHVGGGRGVSTHRSKWCPARSGRLCGGRRCVRGEARRRRRRTAGHVGRRAAGRGG